MLWTPLDLLDSLEIAVIANLALDVEWEEGLRGLAVKSALARPLRRSDDPRPLGFFYLSKFSAISP